MHIEQLPNELLLHICHSCNSIQDLLNFILVNRHFYRVFARSNKLSLLFSVSESELGPLHDAIQVVTYNSSQPTHVQRHPPQSMALLKQLIELGRSAKQWTDIYPIEKWKDDFEERRMLTTEENWHLRRALYRLWLYSKAFHNRRYTRYGRMQRQIILERAELLHNWTTEELAEIEDVRGIIREVIRSQVCPSNGTIQKQFRKRFPESDHQLLFNIHLNYPLPESNIQNYFHSTHHANASIRAAGAMKFRPSARHEPGAEGWGDEVPHYYVVEDMLKLDPGQILWLKDNAPLKGMVEAYVKNLGDWFENNGETFGQTIDLVLQDRGVEAEEFKDAIQSKVIGIVRAE